MTRAIGLALIAAGALVLAAAQGPIWAFLRASGSPTWQRPLAGATPGSSVARVPTRVVLIDGLSRDDAPRLPALERVCARGLALVVDVGFPTKSLPAQFALWTGLTPAQAGLSFDNDPIATPARAIPAQVPGAIAVVENTRGIAGSFGFARLAPDELADADAPAPDPARVAAWRDHGFADAAADAVASAAPLVFVHVLAVDDAAHAVGRGAPAYDRALAYADAVLDRVAAHVPAGAVLLVLADHGHIARGGHGDAEPECRFVRACISPSPLPLPLPLPLPSPPSIHLIDLARWIADRTGAVLDRDARGRALEVAIASPDPDATLPAPSLARWILALLALALLLIGAARAGAPAWALAWPAAAIALAALVPGLPTLSRRPHLALAWIATAAPIAAIAAGLAWRAVAPRALALACIAPAAAIAIACAILAGMPAAIAGGAPARMPWWTGELTFWLAQTAAALTAAGLALFVRRPDSSLGPRR